MNHGTRKGNQRRSTFVSANVPYSLQLQWINEYSDVGSQISQQQDIKLAKAQSSYF